MIRNLTCIGDALAVELLDGSTYARYDGMVCSDLHLQIQPDEKVQEEE